MVTNGRYKKLATIATLPHALCYNKAVREPIGSMLFSSLPRTPGFSINRFPYGRTEYIACSGLS